jgi:hypothetical protein
VEIVLNGMEVLLIWVLLNQIINSVFFEEPLKTFIKVFFYLKVTKFYITYNKLIGNIKK